MLSNVLGALALTATVLAQTSPLYLFASTAELRAVDSADLQPNPSAAQLKEIFYRSIESCPTKHYAVIVEPVTLSYNSAHIPEVPNNRSVQLEFDIDGHVNINHVLNIILMDCLHHNVLRVETLDPTKLLPDLDRDTIRKSIMYAEMPPVDVTLTRKEYNAAMKVRKDYVEGITGKYFNHQDYTLVYVRENEVQVQEEIIRHEDEQEIPLIGDY